ncbi:MAG: guanylate kinase [Gammaproteobacteria bacterium]|jgi:guanylate kinase
MNAASAEGSGGQPARGRLIVISAPSGAGKTSLVRALLASDPNTRFSTSFTTRPPRRGEQDGSDYFFVTEREFREMVAAGEFLEHARVFDNLYGTSRSQVEELMARGRDVLLEIDWQGARQIRAVMPDCLSIFILPPSAVELERRLRGRSTDSDATISRRLRDAHADMSHWDEFDYAVINDDFDTAVAELVGILAGEAESSRTSDPEQAGRIALLMAQAPAFP